MQVRHQTQAEQKMKHSPPIISEDPLPHHTADKSPDLAGNGHKRGCFVYFAVPQLTWGTKQAGSSNSPEVNWSVHSEMRDSCSTP